MNYSMLRVMTMRRWPWQRTTLEKGLTQTGALGVATSPISRIPCSKLRMERPDSTMHTLAFLGTFLTSIVSEAQMKRMLLITPLISILLLLPSRVSGQEWRGIQLLRSNCDDVKRALGIDRCEYPRTTYRLNDETVTVSFESCPCPIVCYHESSGWNVPPGTVGSIIRQLHEPLPIANFDVSSRKWTTQHTDFIGQ